MALLAVARTGKGVAIWRRDGEIALWSIGCVKSPGKCVGGALITAEIGVKVNCPGDFGP